MAQRTKKRDKSNQYTFAKVVLPTTACAFCGFVIFSFLQANKPYEYSYRECSMVDVVYMMTKTAYTFNYINSLNIDYSKDISGIINKVHDLKFDDLEWTKTMKNVLTTRGDTSAAMKKRPIISWLEEFYSAKKQKDGF